MTLYFLTEVRNSYICEDKSRIIVLHIEKKASMSIMCTMAKDTMSKITRALLKIDFTADLPNVIFGYIYIY